MSNNYDTQDLKDAFPQLQGVEDYVLIPLFDTVFGRWVKQAKDGTVVTDALELDSRTRCFVVEGKLVELAVSMTDIDYDDEDESWWKVSDLHLDGDARAASCLRERIHTFVSGQNLGALVRAAGASLKQGKTYHLREDVNHFYFESAFARQKAPQP